MELVDKELGCLFCIFCVEIQYAWIYIMVKAFKWRKCKIWSNSPFDLHCLGISGRSRQSLSGSSTCKYCPANPARLFCPEIWPDLEVIYCNKVWQWCTDAGCDSWQWYTLVRVNYSWGEKKSSNQIIFTGLAIWDQDDIWTSEFHNFIIPAHWCILGGPDWINLSSSSAVVAAWGEFWNFPTSSGSLWLSRLTFEEMYKLF